MRVSKAHKILKYSAEFYMNDKLFFQNYKKKASIHTRPVRSEGVRKSEKKRDEGRDKIIIKS